MKNQKKTMSVEQKESEGFDFNSLVMLCLQTHEEMKHQAARSVNTALVVRNWLIGWYVVEYEQCGADRAVYGASTLKRLSAALKKTVSRGFSVDSLEQIRRFFWRIGMKLPLWKNPRHRPRFSRLRFPRRCLGFHCQVLNL